MRNFKLTLEYDGTGFNGWQTQKQNERTVQGELEKACARIFQQKVNVVGSGRTDSGAHALGQVGHVRVESILAPPIILKALNAILPKDIAIIDVEEVNAKFHAQRSTRSKTYRYSILNRPQRAALGREFHYFYPYPLNVSAMRREVKFLVGRKDFRSFQATDPLREDQSSVRRITAVRLRRQGDFIFIDVTANGFLYKMVRNIVGTLLEVGGGRLPAGSVQKILKAKNRKRAGPTAPARGLCLLKVLYKKNFKER